MTAAGPGKTSPPRGGRCPWRSSALRAKKSPPQRAGTSFAATFAGPGCKGRCPQRSSALRVEKSLRSSAGALLHGDVRRAGRQRALSVAVGALSGWKKRLPQQRGGHFCAATFAGPDGKGRCPQRSSALWAKKHLRSSAGAFLCGNVRRAGRQRALFAVVGAFSGRKDTSAAARGRFCAAMFAGPDGKGRCPRRSGRSPSRKNVPHSARERLSRLVWPYGGAKRPAAPGLTSGGALAPLRPPPFPHPPQRAGPDASPPGARACTGPRRRRRPTGGRRTSGGCRNDSA